MKIFKIELMVIDFDGLGEESVLEELQNMRYANDCISPEVKSIESRDIEWRDDHPLNTKDTADAEYRRLFKESPHAE